MPPGIPFHSPLLYNQQQLQQILANLEKITFLKLGPQLSQHVRPALLVTIVGGLKINTLLDFVVVLVVCFFVCFICCGGGGGGQGKFSCSILSLVSFLMKKHVRPALLVTIFSL